MFISFNLRFFYKKEIFEKNLNELYETIKKRRLGKIEIPNDEKEIFDMYPSLLILSLTSKELKNFSIILKIAFDSFELNYNKFDLQDPEKKLEMLLDVFPGEIYLFNKIPEWIHRFSSNEIKLIIDFMYLMMVMNNMKKIHTL